MPAVARPRMHLIIQCKRPDGHPFRCSIGIVESNTVNSLHNEIIFRRTYDNKGKFVKPKWVFTAKLYLDITNISI